MSAKIEEELPWDARILARIDAGIDPTLVVENLRRTPTERLRRMQEMLRFLDQVRTLERSESSDRNGDPVRDARRSEAP